MSQHLISASEAGNLEKVREYLDRGQDVNWSGKSRKMTALLLAILGRHEEIVRLLIERGAKVNLAIEGQEQTPLDLAAGIGSTAMVCLLLESGADPRIIRNPHGVTALMIAAKTDAPEMTDRLIEAGADVNACTTKRETPLTFARRYNRNRIIEVLIAAGATESVPQALPVTIPWPELIEDEEVTQISPEMTLWAFIHVMNRWEMASSRKFKEAQKTNTIDEVCVVISDELKPIFDRFCTPRDRAYGRTHFGNMPEYDPKLESLIEIGLEKPSRAVIVTRHESLGNFRYVVLKKREGWRIDQKKIKNSDTWDLWTL